MDDDDETLKETQETETPASVATAMRRSTRDSPEEVVYMSCLRWCIVWVWLRRK